jgi:hypothetical protein
VAGNSAGSGGGVSAFPLAPNTLTNCIVYFNTATEGPDWYGGISLNYCCTTPMPIEGVGNMTNVPLFVDLTGGNLRLQAGSPCINRGLNAVATNPTDLDGDPRIVGGAVDIGAYEFQGPAEPTIAFTKITTGALVAEKAHWHCAAWGDYDNDGYPDVFIHQHSPAVKDLLYRNNQDGTFTALALPAYTVAEAGWGPAWGDYDNDGWLDLFIPQMSGQDVLLHNQGDGAFERIEAGPGSGSYISTSGTWGDYDRDGWLDLFVVNSKAGMSAGMNRLYRNQGDGTFAQMGAAQVGDILQGSDRWGYACWIDYDDDGWLDAFTTVWTGARPYLYRNLGNGSFVRITDGPLVSTSLTSSTFAWADYDNDGRLDVLVGMNAARPNILFRNEGAGTFRQMTAAEVGPVAIDSTGLGGIAWGDYDNDGFQDLFIAGGWYASGQYVRMTNLFYHNNGDGSFTRETSGSPAQDMNDAMGAYWVDYDLDGFIDLFVQNHGDVAPTENFLYRNNGNPNAWLEVRCVGTSSPRFGVGAKVRAKTAINGLPMWQLRLVDGGGTSCGGQSFVAHFGLGDATNVDVLRIEWPSGIVQELHNVPARQFLTVTEPPRLLMTQAGKLQVRCWKGQCFTLETSTDLRQWQSLATLTNANAAGTLEFSDEEVVQHLTRFFRAVKR